MELTPGDELVIKDSEADNRVTYLGDDGAESLIIKYNELNDVSVAVIDNVIFMDLIDSKEMTIENRNLEEAIFHLIQKIESFELLDMAFRQ